MACDFNATTSKAENTTAALGVTGVFTVSAWAYADGQGEGSAGSIFVMDEARNSMSLQLSSVAANLEFKVIFSVTAGEWRFSFVIGQWNFVSVSYDPSNVANVPVARVNGVNQTVTTSVPAVGTFTAPNAGYCIGARTAGTNTWDGMITDTMVHLALLTDGEKDTLMRHPGFVRNSLALHIPLHDATDLSDLSGNQFNATGSNLANRVGGPPCLPLFAGWSSEVAAVVAAANRNLFAGPFGGPLAGAL